MFPRLSLAEESLHLNFLSHSQGSSSFPGLLSSACSRPPHPYLSAPAFCVRVWVCKHKHGHLLFSTHALCVHLMPRGCPRQEFFWPRETSGPSSRTAPQLWTAGGRPEWPQLSASGLRRVQGATFPLLGFVQFLMSCELTSQDVRFYMDLAWPQNASLLHPSVFWEQDRLPLDFSWLEKQDQLYNLWSPLQATVLVVQWQNSCLSHRRPGFNFWLMQSGIFGLPGGASGKEHTCQCRWTWEMWVWFLAQEDSLGKEVATHSSILVWRIPWTEEPGGLYSVGHKELDTDEATWHSTMQDTNVKSLVYKNKQNFKTIDSRTLQ